MKNGLFKLIAVALILSLLASMVMAVGTESSVNSNSSLTPETIFTGDPSEPEEDATQESTESEDPTESLIPTESEEPTTPTEPGDGSHTSTEPTESESEPVDPTDPEDEPEAPTEATEPTTETEPSEEESTTGPTDPEGEPEEPTEPTEPEEEPEEPTESEDPTEPEKPQYIYPDDWSRPALVFVVENGILQGDQNYNLNPDKNMTRAQMAAVLTRLLDASGTADLSVYTDVDPAAWYATELSAAVAAGIFNGTSATTFAPNKPLTREQAMVVLCRAFGITTESPKAYKEFTDGASVGEYARFAVGAMKELGIVKGYSDGSLKPQKTITRAEIAQLLYNLFDVIANTPAELPEEGRVLYRGTEPLPSVLTIQGTLILANGTPKDLQVENWNIEDTLVIRTQDGISLDLSGLTAKRLVVCAGGQVTSSVDRVWLGGMAENGVTYRGNASYLGSILGSHNAIGNYTSVLVRGGSIAIDGSALDLELSPDTQAIVNSSSRNVTMSKRSVLQLEGSCDTAVVGTLANLTVSGSCPTLSLKPQATATIHGSCNTVTVGEGAVLEVKGNVEALSTAPSAKALIGGYCTNAAVGSLATVDITGDCPTIDVTSQGTATVGGRCTTAKVGSQAMLSVNGYCHSVETASYGDVTIVGNCNSAKIGDHSTLSITGYCNNVETAVSCKVTIVGDCSSAKVGSQSSFSVTGYCANVETASYGDVTIGSNCTTAKCGSRTKLSIGGVCIKVEIDTLGNVTVGGNCTTAILGTKGKLTVYGDCTTAELGDYANLGLSGSCKTLKSGPSASITINRNCTTANLGASSILILGGASDSITMNGYSKVTALGHIKRITMREWDTLILNGTADNIVVEKANASISGTGRAKLITAHSRYYTCTLTADTIDDVWRTPYVIDYDNALKTVQTMRVPCTVNYDTNLYANRNLTGYLVTLPKGARVYNERQPSDGTIKLSYTDKNGKTWIGWASRYSCTVHTSTKTTDGNLDYSTGTKEGWVDQKGYASTTDYLIWVSRYTQKVMVFKGTKGNWKLVKTMPCSSGSNYTPTPAGTYTIESRIQRWHFSNYYTDYVSVFYGGHAFHSIPMNFDDTVHEGRVGIPLSAGCVRMLMPDCEYIYNLPMGTTVVIW